MAEQDNSPGNNGREQALRTVQAFTDDAAERRARLEKMLGPSIHTPENNQRAQEILSELEKTDQGFVAVRAGFLEKRVEYLQEHFPEVLEDARRLVGATSEPPWEAAYFPDDQTELIAMKYDVQWARHRPHPDDISLVTNLFYECAETVLELSQLESGQANAQKSIF